MNIMTGLQPTVLLENKLHHRYFSRILYIEHFLMAAFVFRSTLEYVTTVIITSFV